MLPANAGAFLYIEVADAAEQQPIPGVASPTVCWLHRDGREPGMSTVLEVIAWVAYAVPVLILFLWPVRKPAPVTTPA